MLLSLRSLYEAQSSGGSTSAIRFDSQADLLRSAAPVGATTYTIGAFVRLVADRNTFSTAWSLDNAASTRHLVQTGADGTTVNVYTTGGGQIPGTPPSLNTTDWAFLCLSVSSGVPTLYMSRPLGTLATHAGNNLGALTPTQFTIGGNTIFNTEFISGDIAGVKVWTAALTQTEVEAEAASLAPVVTASLWAYYPLQDLASMLQDASGNGRHLTNPSGTGSWTLVDGPSVSGASSQTLTAQGIASTAAVGNPTPSFGDITRTAVGLPSTATLGNPTPSLGAISRTAVGIASAAALGAPTVSTGVISRTATPIASTAALGAPTLSVGAITVSATAVDSTTTLGTPTASSSAASQTLNAASIAPTLAMGAPSATPGAISRTAVGIASTGALGLPTRTHLNRRGFEVDANTLGLWRLDETDANDNAIDASGNGRDLARNAAGGPPPAGGLVGGARRLSLSTHDFRRSISADTAMQNAARGAHTIEQVFDLEGATLSGAGNTVGLSNSLSEVVINANRSVSLYLGGVAQTTAAGIIPASGKTYLFIRVFVSANTVDRTADVYVNGVWQANLSWTAPTFGTNGQFVIGMSPIRAALYDEVRFSNITRPEAHCFAAWARLSTDAFEPVAIEQTSTVGLATATVGPAPQTLSATGVASTAAIGLPTRSLGGISRTGLGIASASTVGSPAIPAQALSAASVAPDTTLGTPSPSLGDITRTAVGIGPSVAVGLPTTTVGGLESVVGIASTALVGAPSVSVGPVSRSAVGVSSTAAVGSPSVAVGPVTRTALSVGATSTLGAPSVSVGGVTLSAAGVASTTTVGAPSLSSGATTVSASGISSTLTLGSPTRSLGGITRTALSIAPASSLGTPFIGVVFQGATAVGHDIEPAFLGAHALPDFFWTDAEPVILSTAAEVDGPSSLEPSSVATSIGGFP